jgi:hypothetical protein
MIEPGVEGDWSVKDIIAHITLGITHRALPPGSKDEGRTKADG